MDRTGFAAGTLAVREGLRAELPTVDPRSQLTMADMGHDMSAMSAEKGGGPTSPSPDPHAGHGASPVPTTANPHAGHRMPAQTPTSADPHAAHQMPAQPPPDPHAGHDMSAMSGGGQQHPPSERSNPLVDMQTMAPASRLDDPGIGLRDNGRHVLRYAT
jgi:FtsP/CotA-like multicopper oxidase with cupredoxin domain